MRLHQVRGGHAPPEHVGVLLRHLIEQIQGIFVVSAILLDYEDLAPGSVVRAVGHVGHGAGRGEGLVSAVGTGTQKTILEVTCDWIR